MQFTVDHKSLNAALSSIQGSIGRKSTIPMLEHVSVSASDGRVHLRATDMDMEASVSLDADVQDAGGCLIPGTAFAGIAKRAKAEVSFFLQSGQVTIQTGRSKVVLPVLPPDDFPHFIPPDGTSFDIDGGVLADLIRNTQFACERGKGGREYLEGVHIVSRDGMLAGVATNGHVLAVSKADCSTAFDGVTIPMASLNQIVGMCDKAGTISVTVSPAKFALSGNGMEFVTKVLDGASFPDYQRIVPAGNDWRMVVSLDPFREAIDIASVVADGKVKAVTLAISGDDSLVRLSMSGGDGRTAENNIECEADFDLTVKYNVSYILGALNALDCERIQFALGEANGACLLTNPQDPYTEFVMMPMRV